MLKLNKITELPETAVVFDSETTGFDPEAGDRIVELGAVKMLDGMPTNDKLHLYINPNRSVPQSAVEVHGLTTEFLSQYPSIEQVIGQFVDFVGDLPMIAHNSKFDAKFLNFELAAMGMQPYAPERYYDSIAVARRLYPGASANLDALCKRHNISLASRDKHGALLDSELLAEVIVEMGGGRQTSLFDEFSSTRSKTASKEVVKSSRDTFIRKASAEELERHAALVAKLGADAIWNRIPA